ncbi:hypothetical protein [Psychromonas sp. MME2]|uniref:hypothetical protein n=1 Tax=Psychromonas sp. MME2 TaxID=3231033 RepID=UPI00339C83A4
MSIFIILTSINSHELCELLETTADGRELRNQLFKAWRSKKSRDSDNGKKLYTFNMSIKAGDQLKKLAKGKPLNQTLEKLIFAGKQASQATQKEQLKIARLSQENGQLREKLNTLGDTNNSEEAHMQSLINKDLQVKALANLKNHN